MSKRNVQQLLHCITNVLPLNECDTLFIVVRRTEIGNVHFEQGACSKCTVHKSQPLSLSCKQCYVIHLLLKGKKVVLIVHSTTSWRVKLHKLFTNRIMQGGVAIPRTQQGKGKKTFELNNSKKKKLINNKSLTT